MRIHTTNIGAVNQESYNTPMGGSIVEPRYTFIARTNIMRVNLKMGTPEYGFIGRGSKPGLYVDQENEFYALVLEDKGSEVVVIPSEKIVYAQTSRAYKFLKPLRELTIS
jgi:hypothetical protein